MFMNAHRWVMALGLCAALAVPLASVPAVAQDQTAPEVPDAKYKFSGTINSSAVYVRSGPGESYYPTLKLEKGDAVTVVGMKFDWLKIVPPPGSFCYISQAHVQRRGDGSVGRVTKNDVLIKAGSTLNAVKYMVLSKLDEGADVKILGEADEYFKIAPPPGTFLFVNKQYVDPGKALSDTQPVAEAATEKTTDTAAVDTTSTPDRGAADNHAAVEDSGQQTPSTQQLAADTQPAATQAAMSAEAAFEKLETEFQTATNQKLEEQPLDDLIKGYEPLAKSGKLAESMRRIAEFRLSVLKLRVAQRVQLDEARKADELVRQRRQAMGAEREELQQRIKESGIAFYTAVGTLQTSSLQQGGETLYRLTDPANGRTIVYIRSNDSKLPAMLGQFIGVKGDVVTDQVMSLRSITPTSYETVDVDKVNKTVAAQIMPPSLLHGTTTAP